MKTSFGRRILLAAAAPTIALVFAVVLSSIVLLVSGSNPVRAYGEMLANGSKLETIIDMLNRATPLYVSGVAAAIGFRMNLFNIGVEGQYILAGFFSAAIGAYIFLPAILHVTVIVLIAVIVGAGWSGLAGVLKVKRGVNEVISTIMLNFLAIGGFVAWLSVAWREGELSTTSGTREIAETGWLPNINWMVELFTRDIGRGRQLSGVLLIAIAVGIVFHVLVNRTRFGFDLRASGFNPFAARAGGVPPDRMIVMAMVLSGGAAGLVGMVDILSKAHRYDVNFTPGLGFAGIAVALLGRNHAVGIAVSALLFAFMDASSPVLQISGSASPEIVVIMQGIILLAAVIAYESVNRYRRNEEARAAADALPEAES